LGSSAQSEAKGPHGSVEFACVDVWAQFSDTDVEEGPEFGFKPGSTDQYSDWHKREYTKIGEWQGALKRRYVTKFRNKECRCVSGAT